MKLYPIILVFGLLGCSGCHSNPTAKQPPTDQKIDGCNAVYQRVLELTYDERVDPEHEYTGEQRKWAIHLLDEQFIATKHSERFFAFCLNKMNEEQINCAKDATTFETFNTCIQLIPNKGK